ncbi:MAG: diguanylate cyclase [Candidatus Omnitrophota bacterium]
MVKKVVIIKNPKLKDSFSKIFVERGYEVFCVDNGLKGIEAVCEQCPDLIVLDPAVEDIKGCCVYKFLKDRPKYGDLPILILDDEKGICRFWGIEPGNERNVFKLTAESDPRETIFRAIKLSDSKFQENRFQAQNNKINKLLLRLAKADEFNKGFILRNSTDAIQELLDEIIIMLNAEVGSLMLTEEGTNDLVIKAAKGISPEIVDKTRVEVGRGISGWVAKTGVPLLVRDIGKDKRFQKESDKRYYTPSLLSVPIMAEGKIIGVINVNNKSSKGFFDENDLCLLTILANTISIVMESLNWRNMLKQNELELEKLKNSKRLLENIICALDDELYELTISQEISNIIYSRLDHREIIRAILGIIEHSIDYHVCGILFLDEEKRVETVAEIKYPATQKQIDDFKLRMVETFNNFTDEAFSSAKGYIGKADEVAQDRCFTDGGNALNSYQANLLKVNGRTIGILAIANSFSNAFSGEDVRIFSVIARHASIAINNALLHKKIKELSVMDGLTGLYVYRYFNDVLDKEILRAGRYMQKLGLVMMDLDGFKKVNDNFGHPKGDEALKETACILRKICREVDIVSRYGGEEFAIMLPETDIEGAFVLADRVRAVIKNYAFGTKDNAVNLTASFGVAGYPESALSKMDLIEKVDSALYRAKEAGGDSIRRAEYIKGEYK